MKRLDKVYNEHLILDALKAHDGLSIPSIATISHLSRPTIDTAIKKMENNGLVVNGGLAESESGRRPALWKINGNYGFFIGIDFEPPVVRVLVLNMRREEVISETHIMPDEFIPSDVLTRLTEIIINCITRKLGFPIERLKAISIGNPGNINNREGISISMHNAPNWKNVSIVSYLQKIFNCPVFLENVILFMANVEREHLVKEGLCDFVYIALRTGVGAGLCISGKLYNGPTGNAGHFGFIPISNPVFTDERCLEESSDSVMILMRMKQYRMIPQNAPAQIPFTNDHLDLLTDEAARGNKNAMKILEEIADYWAYGIASAISLLDISVFVIGGMLAYINARSPQIGAYFLQSIHEKYLEKYQTGKIQTFTLKFAEYYGYAAALGGALFGYEDYFTKLDLPVLESTLLGSDGIIE